MTPEEFNERSLHQKSEIVWEWGYCITKRKTEHSKVVLFSLENFFVEMFFSIYDKQAKDIKAVRKEDLHSDYLPLIKTDNPFFRLVLKDSQPVTGPAKTA